MSSIDDMNVFCAKISQEASPNKAEKQEGILGGHTVTYGPHINLSQPSRIQDIFKQSKDNLEGMTESQQKNATLAIQKIKTMASVEYSNLGVLSKLVGLLGFGRAAELKDLLKTLTNTDDAIGLNKIKGSFIEGNKSEFKQAITDYFSKQLADTHSEHSYFESDLAFEVDFIKSLPAKHLAQMIKNELPNIDSKQLEAAITDFQKNLTVASVQSYTINK